MASIQKFPHAAMCQQCDHVDRLHRNPGNKEIDPGRTHLNYSFPMDHHGLKPFAYYKQLLQSSYLYGRGTKKEKDAITGCGWIVTLPRELLGDLDREKAFFKGVYDFISARYGAENIIDNAVHYDEGGLPHIHVIFSPITDLDHNVVQYKTRKTAHATQLASGRYEYTYVHVDRKGKTVDENNPETWVKLTNYARKSDAYDRKVDCSSVINKVELQHFHPDLQAYLASHGIAGQVVTGKTGTNFTVKELKKFTANTGFQLDDVREMILDGNPSILEGLVEKYIEILSLEHELSEKEVKIKELSHLISSKNQEIDTLTVQNQELKSKLLTMEKSIERIQAQEKTAIPTPSHAWGRTAGWGETQKEEEKLW